MGDISEVSPSRRSIDRPTRTVVSISLSQQTRNLVPRACRFRLARKHRSEVCKARDMKPGGERENIYKYPSVTQADPFTIRSRRRCRFIYSDATSALSRTDLRVLQTPTRMFYFRSEKNNVSTLHFNI